MKLLLVALVSVLFAGCGLIDMPAKMDKTNENMGKMIEGMDHTNRAVDKQSKLIPFENMLKAENTENLNPIPFKIMAYGQELAEALSADDVVAMVHLWLKDIDEGGPDRKKGPDGEDLPLAPEEIAKMNHDKMALVKGLQIVTGFLPQTTVAQMIQKQVYEGGPYEKEVYSALMLRSMFIQEILMKDLLDGGLYNVGRIKKVVNHNADIDFIARLPFAKKISVETRGFVPAEKNLQKSFSPDDAVKNWSNIQAAAEYDCNVTDRAVLTGDPAQDEAYFQAKVHGFQEAMAKIKSYLSSWGQNT